MTGGTRTMKKVMLTAAAAAIAVSALTFSTASAAVKDVAGPGCAFIKTGPRYFVGQLRYDMTEGGATPLAAVTEALNYYCVLLPGL